MMAWIRAIRLILTLSCAQSARLMSDRQDRDLSGAEGIALHCHVRICRSCRRLENYFSRLRESLEPGAVLDQGPESHAGTGSSAPDSGLSRDAHRRILDGLRGSDRQS